MSAGRGDPNTPGNRPLFLSDGVPNLGCHNLVAPAAAGNTGSIASQVLFSPCSTSVMNTIQEVSAPQSAQLIPISRATEQDDVPCIQPSWNVPGVCTQVPINIIVFHRQLTGRGSRAQLPPSTTTALPDVSEGASVRLAGSNFLSLGSTSNAVACDMTTNSSQIATPDKYNSEHLRPNCLCNEASKTENGIETSQLPQLATAVSRNSYNDLGSVIPAATWETRVQHYQESNTLLAESTTDDNIHMYQSMQKRLKTQINQSEHTPLSTPTVAKEKTLTQIEMQIASAKKTEMFRNEETPALKMKARKKKHRPKVIRENKLAKVKKPDSTPDGTSPNQKVKRSYVRKKRNLSSLEKCSGPFSDQSISRATGVAARSRTALVRRSLQFESKEQGLQGGHSSMTNSHHHNYETPVHGHSFYSESEVQTGHTLQVGMENSPGELAFDMSLRLNKLLDEYMHLPEMPKPTQEVSTATSGSFSTELAREEDNLGRTCKPDGKSKCSLFEERVVKPIIEGNKKYLELNYPDADGLISSATLPEIEPAGSQIGKVSEMETPTHHRNGSLPGKRDSVVLRTAAEMLAIFQAGAIKKKRSARLHRNSFFSVMDLENNTLQASTRPPQPCMDALYKSSCIKFMTKKRSEKARPHCSSSIQPNDELKNRLSAESTFACASNGSKISEESSPNFSPQTMYNERINFDTHCEVAEGRSANTSTGPCSSSIQPNDELKNRPSAESTFACASNGSKISEQTSPNFSPQTIYNETINFDTHCEVAEGRLANTSTGPYMDYLQGVASKLKHLDLNTEQVHRTEMHLSLTAPTVISFERTSGPSNALVPYGGAVMVPYGRPLQLVKKQRPRAKVDLDFETTRVWNLLMGKSAEPDGTDVEKERWWQQEREVFQGRANSFIARMRLVQGDRRFSPWKGSVVDSVVGVFLTQNVADHLSSSAYMALAASFPSQSVNNNCKDAATTEDNEQTTSTSALVGEKSVFDLFNNVARPDLQVGCEEVSMTYKKTHMEPKDNTRDSELIEGETYSFDYKSTDGSVCNHQGTVIEHEEQQLPDFSSVQLTASTELVRQIQIQKISSSRILTSETIQSRLSLSSEIPRNFVCGGSAAAYKQLGSNFDQGRPLTGNDATASENKCHRLQMAAMNDNGFGKPEIPSSSAMPFFLTADTQQLKLRNEANVSSTSSNSPSDSASPNLKNGTSPLFMTFNSYMAECSSNKISYTTLNNPKTSTELPVKLHHDKRSSFEAPDLKEHESVFPTHGMAVEATRKEDEYASKSGFTSCNGVPDKAAEAPKPKKTRTATKKNAENFDWDKLRRQACSEGQMKKRSFERRDSVDWEAVRCADVQRISHAIRERGMNNILAERIQNFLNRLVRDHGSIDLEWLRHVPPDSAKDYLLSIRGLGLKSVECVRLLTLHHLAFPVDTNVGRICVRLGWVPIQPLPESLQLHLLELYPILETIQKYLWPRLCKLDQQTLYELHYQMITFGKVFCTKSKPNCNACPMRSECKHFASAFASARLALPAPQEKSLVKSSNQFAFQNSSMHNMSSIHLPRLEGGIHAREFLPKNSEPIIEEPESPREEGPPETIENDIEDFYEDGEIPTIKLNMEAFAQNLENCIKESNNELQSDDIAKALVAISTEAASIPVPKLKNVHRLRTEHYVYELPDAHPLLQQLGLDQREPDDPTPYLLAIWTPDGIKEITKTPKPCCDPQMGDDLCNNEMCHNCTAERENQSRYARGTILVPCRTAMRGSFPLNGTYFQVNEVFADHRSSHNPIHVEREQLWNLQRRMVFFGTSVPTIFKGLTTEEIQQCFWRGFVCVRGFDMETRAPRPLCPHLHVVARPKARKTAATEQVL